MLSTSAEGCNTATICLLWHKVIYFSIKCHISIYIFLKYVIRCAQVSVPEEDKIVDPADRFLPKDFDSLKNRDVIEPAINRNKFQPEVYLILFLT